LEPGELESPGSARSRDRRRAAAAVALERARDALAPFGRGAHVFGVNKGQFSMIDIAAAVLEMTGPADVSVWTWVVAGYEVEAVSAFLNTGAIRSFRMVIDWTGAQRDMPYVADLQRRYGVDCIRVTKTHAKIVTISTDDGWRVVVRGSMNLNANPRFEQFDVSDDPTIFGVMAELEAELWRRGKALPVRELEHADAVNLLAKEGEAIALPDWAKAPGKRWF
jgi:hypothetical protein